MIIQTNHQINKLDSCFAIRCTIVKPFFPVYAVDIETLSYSLMSIYLRFHQNLKDKTKMRSFVLHSSMKGYVSSSAVLVVHTNYQNNK